MMSLRLGGRLAVALFLWFASSAFAETRQYTLSISAGTLTVNGAGGASIPAWGYSLSGSPSFPGPTLTAKEGDTMSITVVNNHNISHNFVIRNLVTDATPIAPGSSRTYSFTAGTAGTYLYYDNLNKDINRAMGLYGMLWIAPADGSARAWTSGPSYTFQRLWVLGDMDKKRWNDVAAAGGAVDTGLYKPNYFIMNGQGGFDAMHNPATTIEGNVGQTALVRIANGGQFAQSLHFHSNHAQVISINGQRQTTPFREVDVINIPPLSTAEVLYYLNQPGHYPMHNHTAQMETANGVYLNGVATMIMMH